MKKMIGLFKESHSRHSVTIVRTVTALALIGTFLPSLAAPEDNTLSTPLASSAAASATDQDGMRVQTRQLTFAKLSNQEALHLRTTEGSASLNFGARNDELITKAVLKLRYVYSPALIPGESHIKVLLNGELVNVIQFSKENAGRVVTQDIELDPRFITGFNKLTMQFVGHYTGECEDPLHTSLWADISGSSVLELSVRPIAVKSDLAMLPQPFFDPQDYSRLNLPFVFAGKPSYDTLRSAGITSSWFGKLAAWRGARFPAYLDRLPKGHAVVLATNSERPSFLADAPQFTGPGLTVMTNPADGYSKLLLISGRDEADLKTATSALVLGNGAMSGTHIDITKVREEAPRKAYDAPNWVRMDRPMKFGELVESPQQLQVFGHVPDTIRINLRMPPDLFTWRSTGVPVNLKFRYTPPIRASESRLVMGINDELVQGINLRSSGQTSDLVNIALPMLDGSLYSETREIRIPAYKLEPIDQLQYRFSFTYHKEGACRDTQVENVQAMIDPNSTIDFSGYPHYVEMPHLGYFATAGFPFTKYADLAQTTVVMPQTPSAEDIEVMLTVLGRMGESTGYPATRVTVAGPSDKSAQKDKDLLVIGVAPNQSLLDKWSDKLPAVITGGQRKISQPARGVSFLYDWLGFGTEPDTDVATQEMMQGNGPLAAMLGFESPVTSDRSVVAITAETNKDLTQVLDVLDNNVLVKTLHGSAAFIRGDKVESVLAGDTYTLGTLPFWLSIWYPISERPWLEILLSLIAAFVIIYGLWRGLKALTKRRGDRA
jgi:hypothetical protein